MAGKDMSATHLHQGITPRDFNVLVENPQRAMDKEGVPFAAQNKLLAKLAPMSRAGDRTAVSAKKEEGAGGAIRRPLPVYPAGPFSKY